MENPASPDEGLIVRIRHELDKLPLSDGQKEKVLPSLLKRARFLDARNGKRDRWEAPGPFRLLRFRRQDQSRGQPLRSPDPERAPST